VGGLLCHLNSALMSAFDVGRNKNVSCRVVEKNGNDFFGMKCYVCNVIMNAMD
jgi:hypothetical protein